MGTPGLIEVGFPGGKKVSFSALATEKYFEIPHVRTGQVRPHKPVACDTFGKTVRWFHDGLVDEILVPIRNNNSRHVQAMQKMLRDVNGEVAGEIYLYVQQCALVLPLDTPVDIPTRINMLTRGWSMGPALEQTENFIRGRKLGIDPKDDTAAAAKELKKKKFTSVV